MSKYRPDCWVIIRISPNGQEPHYRILAGWYGGYLDGDHWKINSGIEKVEVEGDYYKFIGTSGSTYYCHKEAERLSGMTSSVFNMYEEQFREQDAGTFEIVNSKEYTPLAQR